MEQKQRSIILFEQAIKSDATRRNYFFHLNKFKEFYNLEDYDSILTIKPEKLQSWYSATSKTTLFSLARSCPGYFNSEIFCANNSFFTKEAFPLNLVLSISTLTCWFANAFLNQSPSGRSREKYSLLSYITTRSHTECSFPVFRPFVTKIALNA